MSVNDLTYTDVPMPYKHVIFTDLDGLEGVLVDLNSKKYYQLNETASLIWRGIERQLPLDHIASEIADKYEVTLDQAKSSVEKAFCHFRAQNLIGPT